MKLTISRNELADLMAKGGSTSQKVSTIPILRHARLIAKSHTLRVSTSDLDMQAETLGSAKVEVEGSTTVDAEKLKTIVDRLPRDADISLALDGSDLIVKSGRSRSRLPTLPVRDWPALDGKPEGHSADFSISGASLDRLLGRTFPIAALVSAAVTTGSVFLHVRKWLQGVPTLCAVATNSHVLIVTAVELPEGAESLPVQDDGQAGIMLSPITASTILRLFLGEESIRVTVSSTKIILEGATTRFSSKLVEGQYPGYERIVPKLGDDLIRLDRAAAIGAVGFLETFIDKEHKSSTIEAAPVHGGLALASSVGSEGEGFTVTEAEVEGEIPSFGLSSRYLKIVLGAFRVETLTVGLTNPAAPILFEAENETDTIGVIMPMRISGRLAREVANEPPQS